MTALLVGVGALLLAVVVGALLDPSPARKDRVGDDLSSMGECAPAVYCKSTVSSG